MTARISTDRRRAMLRTAMGSDIATALADRQVVEVMVNPDGVLRLDRLGEGRIDTGVRLDPEQVERIIRLVAAHARAKIHGDLPRSTETQRAAPVSSTMSCTLAGSSGTASAM